MNTRVNNRLLGLLRKLLDHHVQREKAYQENLPQTDDAFWELDKQARDEFLAKQSPIDWETTPWQRACSFLFDAFSIEATEYDLRVHIAASKIGLDESDSISVELVRLDRGGTADKLLSVIQDEFPGEWIDLGLPVPSGVEHDKSTAGTAYSEPSIPLSTARAMMDDGTVEIAKIASDTKKKRTIGWMRY